MKKYIPYIVIAVLLGLFVYLLFFTNRKEVVIEKATSDTVTFYKTDTISVKKPTYIKEVIIDTVYLEKSENGAYMTPISQKYYKDSTYEAWVSGYKPSLDSINTFEKTITRIITNTTTKEIYPKTTNVFLDAGADYIGNNLAPNVGVIIKFKNDIILGGNVGYYDKNAYYGLKIGYKIK